MVSRYFSKSPAAWRSPGGRRAVAVLLGQINHHAQGVRPRVEIIISQHLVRCYISYYHTILLPFPATVFGNMTKSNFSHP